MDRARSEVAVEPFIQPALDEWLLRCDLDRLRHDLKLVLGRHDVRESDRLAGGRVVELLERTAPNDMPTTDPQKAAIAEQRAQLRGEALDSPFRLAPSFGENLFAELAQAANRLRRTMEHHELAALRIGTVRRDLGSVDVLPLHQPVRQQPHARRRALVDVESQEP